MKQSGFIALPVMGWAAIAAGVVIVGLGIALKVQSARLETSKAETVATQGRFDAFVSHAKALGEQQAEKAKAQDLLNAQFKEKADVELAKSRKSLAVLYADYNRLRKQRDNSNLGTVSSLPVSATRPDRICFDRTKFAFAVGSLEEGIQGIAEQSDTARLRLATSAEWAKSVGVGTPLVPK